MKQIIKVCFLLIFCYSLAFSQKIVEKRDGILILRNNEVIKGKIVLQNNRRVKKEDLWVLPQGAENYTRIRFENIMKIEFLYSKNNRHYDQLTTTNVWITVYLNDGTVYPMCYMDILTIYCLTTDKRVHDFVVYDGMNSLENVNSIKTILFYPPEFKDTGLDLAVKEDKQETKKVNKHNIYFRTAPNGKRIGKLSKNTKVEVKETKGDWERVKIEGWIHKKLLK